MKTLLTMVLLLGGLSSCSKAGSKFKTPVIVAASEAPVYGGPEIYQDASHKPPIIATVRKGDTLELELASPLDLKGTAICPVKPKADAGQFQGGAKSGYIERRLLIIPDATLATERAAHLKESSASLLK